MSQSNQMHLTIEHIEQIAKTARLLKAKNPKMGNMIAFKKTHDRQDLDSEDGVEYKLLAPSSIHEITEG